MPKCDTCGGEIIFRYIHGRRAPIHLSGGCGQQRTGRPHGTLAPHCSQQDYFWLRHGSITFRTMCWWDGAMVWFHRAENGGCVLFDELGYPWPVHACWLEHRAERDAAVKAILDRHEQRLARGEYTFREAIPVSRWNGSVHRLCGHLHKTRKTFDLESIRHHGVFIRADVLSADELVYHVLFPLEWFPILEGLPSFALELVAWRRGDRVDFFPSTLAVRDESGKERIYKGGLDVAGIAADHWRQIRGKSYTGVFELLHDLQQRPFKNGRRCLGKDRGSSGGGRGAGLFDSIEQYNAIRKAIEKGVRNSKT